ncbi:ribose 5-phosphate isomerase B [Sphingosinicella sp.]|jgi:ribose 5-phosphate isomerase B|uniref:Ribose 5-phosphate isomerase B n=1 Tax=Sphingosinicella xenopeptidilytica TaxID=364098 RepID=A0ABW3C1G6_SPHXN|nr:ribose 5-phosphate isomerase B [Sphingosinicella sp.]MBA4758598.1 ribose 5-phosphate isomerase B [Sphingosinicella sp.]|tara:strand:+ start:47471 stop:47902 length:432 start_codon:yes stop_codon:yes gene_type:complete
MSVIAIGSDHAGYVLKSAVADWLKEAGHEVLDLGTNGGESVDYPDFGRAVGEAVASGKAEKGVVVCGSGIGISIAANRVKGARAALCMNGLMARLSRQHNDANILALGERLIGIETARDCLNEFLNTPFEGGRHQRRVDKLSA